MAVRMYEPSPDKVPVFAAPLDWCWGKYYGSNSYQDFLLDPKKIAKVLVWTAKKLGFRISGAMPPVTPWAAITTANGKHYPDLRWKDFTITNNHKLYSGDPIKDVLYGDPMVKTMKDAKKLVVPDPIKHGRFDVMFEANELARKELKGEVPIGEGGFIYNPIDVAGNIMGWTQVYMAMENDLELWNKVLNVIIEYIFECAKTLIEHGVKTLFSVDCLTPWVGAELLEKPVWMHGNHPPELYERIYDKFGVGTGLHPCTVGPFEIGIPVWKKWLKHTPGFIMSEFGGADALARAKEQLAPATMIGNIHPNDVMLHGNPAIVERTVKDLIKKCAPGGRYVIAPGCVGLPFDVPVENVRAVYDTAEKYGKYPIEL